MTDSNLRQLFCNEKKPIFNDYVENTTCSHFTKNIKYILGVVLCVAVGLFSGVLISQPIAKYVFRDLKPEVVVKTHPIIMGEKEGNYY
ncbi:MAG: hypothetical protein ACYS5V_08330 [Planctomycetota bacterium]|jgi:uncharacterized protein YneF (UPF0154 family)